MKPQPCLDLATLRALLDDTLPEAQQATLAEHLERCVACRERLESLAMPTQFLGAGSTSSPDTAAAKAYAPPRELIELWQNRMASPDDTIEAPDVTGAILGRLDPAEESDELGRLGPYRVRQVLGQGGMGIVLLASDPALRRSVAIKLMLPELAARPEARARFLREARAAAAVQHENVVIIHAVENGGDLPYLVMEYVPGRSLQHRLNAEGPLAADEVASLGGQIAGGLALAHAMGVVHRDVKPANILIDERTGRAKLSDFGLARAVDDPALTQVGIFAGTPDYVAPEQAWGQAVDHRADLYSLGATLFAALTGRPPRTSHLAPGLPPRSDQDAPPSVRSLVPQAPAALDQLIQCMLAYKPADRPQSAEEVARKLGQIAEAETPAAWSRFPWRPAAAVALCGLVLGGFGLGRTWTRGPGPAHQAPPKPGPAQQAPPKPIALEPRTLGPFVLDGNRRFPSLQGAIDRAESGAVIEIEGDGPYATAPIHLGEKALTIRAAPGAVPVLELESGESADSPPGLWTDAPLTLEGLSIRSAGPQNAVAGDDPARFSLFVVRGGTFRAAHCRFEVGPRSACIALVRASGKIQGCQFLGGESVAVSWAARAGQTLDLENNLLVVHGAILVDLGNSGVEPRQATLRLDHATIRASSAIRIRGAGRRLAVSLSGRPHLIIRIEAQRNIIDAEHILTFLNTAPPNAAQDQWTFSAVASMIRSQFAWQGRENVYRPSPSWLSVAIPGRPTRASRLSPKSLEEWGRVWKEPETGSVTATLDFRGPDTSSDPANHVLVAHEGEIAPTRDEPPGADIVKTGPGAAYAAWRSSPAYEAWNSR